MTPCIDIGVAKNCKNPDSYGEICVRCNRCGRFDKYAEQEPIKKECQWHEKEDNICWNEDKPFIECPKGGE